VFWAWLVFPALMRMFAQVTRVFDRIAGPSVYGLHHPPVYGSPDGILNLGSILTSLFLSGFF